jgi:hypothetical protein
MPLTRTDFPDGSVHIQGPETYANRDFLKDRGGRWDPATKAWTFTPEAAKRLGTFPAREPPKGNEIIRRRLDGQCCRSAVSSHRESDPDDPRAPTLCWTCPRHGFYKSTYTGD